LRKAGAQGKKAYGNNAYIQKQLLSEYGFKHRNPPFPSGLWKCSRFKVKQEQNPIFPFAAFWEIPVFHKQPKLKSLF
jgi:hypothetical protein